MEQTITIKLKLQPNRFQKKLLEKMSKTYICVINDLVSEMVEYKQPTKKTTKNVVAPLPSAVKNQAIKDAKSVFTKSKKTGYAMIPILKKPVCIWNNQNYSVSEREISVPLFVDGRSKRIPIRVQWNEKNNRFQELMKGKRGTLRITQKSHKWIAQISVTIPTKPINGHQLMGVDLGLKVPAVAVTEGGQTKFFGNGRMNKFKKRYFRKKRKSLGKAKKIKAIRTIHDKEQRWMKNQDHQISRAIVDFAIKNDVSVIRLEKLKNIRQTARTSRKNNQNLHSWSFYRLANFIEYKANLIGIAVEYVDPAYTSQKCPSCSERNKAADRQYHCKNCGFSTHRDRVGAMNIIHAPLMYGKSASA